MTLDQLLAALLGVGGSGALAALWNVVRAARKGKLEDEETLIVRLNNENKKQQKKADDAEIEADKMRKQRNRASDQAARYRRRLISLGIDDGGLEDLVDFDEH